MEGATTVNGQPELSCVMAWLRDSARSHWLNYCCLRQRLGNTVSLLFALNPTALVSCDVINVCGKMQSSKENCDKTSKAGQFLPGGRKCVIFMSNIIWRFLSQSYSSAAAWPVEGRICWIRDKGLDIWKQVHVFRKRGWDSRNFKTLMFYFQLWNYKNNKCLRWSC
jgi:hypothetical protein